MFSVRDAAFGAIVYPFIIPIGVYQLATKSSPNTCVFKRASVLFSHAPSEALK
jgi:hypothetical protein